MGLLFFAIPRAFYGKIYMWVNQLSVSKQFVHHSPPPLTSTTHLHAFTHMYHLLPASQMSSQFWYAEVDSRYCSFAVKLSAVVAEALFQTWRFLRHMEVVCKFVKFEFIILTCISILTEAVPRGCSVKGILRNFAKITGKQKQSLIDLAYMNDFVSWLTNFCEGLSF